MRTVITITGLPLGLLRNSARTTDDQKRDSDGKFGSGGGSSAGGGKKEAAKKHLDESHPDVQRVFHGSRHGDLNGRIRHHEKKAKEGGADAEAHASAAAHLRAKKRRGVGR